jgi:hypothetical protein
MLPGGKDPHVSAHTGRPGSANRSHLASDDGGARPARQHAWLTAEFRHEHLMTAGILDLKLP